MAIRRNACRSMIVLVDITDFYLNTSQRNTYLALSLPLSLSLTEIFLWLCCHESKILGAKQDRILSHTISNEILNEILTHHHQHFFKKHNNGVLMNDIITYKAPFGPLGVLANHLFINRC